MIKSEKKKLNEIKKIYKKDSIYFALYGDYLFKLGKVKKARTIIEKHLDTYPDYLTGYIVYGNILYFSKEYNRTEEMMKKALEIDPKCSSAYNILGDIYLEKGEKEKYLNFYGEVMRYDPFNLKLRNTVSLLRKDFSFDSEDNTPSKFYTEKELNDTMDKADEEIIKENLNKETQELNPAESEVNDFIIDNESQFEEEELKTSKGESSFEKISFDADLDDIIDEVIDQGNSSGEDKDKKVNIIKTEKLDNNLVKEIHKKEQKPSVDFGEHIKNHISTENTERDEEELCARKDISEFLMPNSISFVNELFGDKDNITVNSESDNFHSDDETINYKDIDAVLSPNDIDNFDIINEARNEKSSFDEDSKFFSMKNNLDSNNSDKMLQKLKVEDFSIENNLSQDKEVKPIIENNILRKFNEIDLVEEERIFASAKQFSSDEEIKSIQVDDENSFKTKIVDKIIDNNKNKPNRPKIKIATSTLGEIYSSQGEFQNAKANYLLLLEKEPDNYEYKLKLLKAEFDISKSRIEEEIEYYRNLVEKYPENKKYKSRFDAYDEEYKAISDEFNTKKQLLNKEKAEKERSKDE